MLNLYIPPSELKLHFSDPLAFAEIYAPGSKFIKDPDFYKTFHQDDALFGKTDPRDAKIRRDVLRELFSRRAILKLERVVQEKV